MDIFFEGGKMTGNILSLEGGTHKQDTGKGTGPMDSQDKEYPGIDRAQLREGYKMCVGNAGRFMNDAALLKEAGRLRSACLILHLAVEELTNAIHLYEAGRTGVQNWEEWWNQYFAHQREGKSFDNLGIEDAGQKFDQIHRELMYVGFDRKDGVFLMPHEDKDDELLEFFDEEAAYAERILKALPSYAFERLEFKEMVQQSPEMAAPVLYARIEEILNEESLINEKDLLTVVAEDMGMSFEDVATGFEQWKKVAPKARAYLDLLHRVQGKLKKERGGRA
jgi:hypothetical protein